MADVLRWHYGPTASDPNPGSLWHDDCGGEVLYVEDGWICARCEMQQDDAAALSVQLDSAGD